LQYAAYSSPKRSESHCSYVNFINTVRYSQKSGGKINTYRVRQNSSAPVQINKNAEKEKTQKSLDAKYATMEERFLAYDKIISKLNNEFSSLKSMIEAEYNKK